MIISRLLPAVAGLSLALVASAAQAVVVSGAVTTGTGAFVKLVPGSDFRSSPADTVGDDNHQSIDLFAFDEDQNIVLLTDLTVDQVNAGLGPTVVSGLDILAGVTVASHYVFFDPIGTTLQRGNVTFDAEIVGVASSTGTMAASDFLANSGVTYLSPTLRGLEAGDSVSFVGQTLFVDWTASSPGDYVRVFTLRSPGADVPVPAAGLLLLTGMAGLAGLRRTRRG
jgi:hypothetical protein